MPRRFFPVLLLLLLPACQNVPKYKKSNGKFNEWASYEGKHFEPISGTVTATDPQANTITITHNTDAKVFAVTPHTRIMHEGADITLAQLPLKETVKYTLSEDGTQLLTVWYGKGIAQFRRPVPQHKEQNTFFQ